MTKAETDKLVAAQQKYPKYKRVMLAKVTGISESAVRRWLRGSAESRKTNSQVCSAQLEVIGVDALLSQHDIAGKAIQLLKTVRAGQTVSDDSLRRVLGVGIDRWHHTKKSAALAGFFALLPDKRMVWGKPETIDMLQAKLKELL